jgi:hypothetical protein
MQKSSRVLNSEIRNLQIEKGKTDRVNEYIALTITEGSEPRSQESPGKQSSCREPLASPKKSKALPTVAGHDNYVQIIRGFNKKFDARKQNLQSAFIEPGYNSGACILDRSQKPIGFGHSQPPCKSTVTTFGYQKDWCISQALGPTKETSLAERAGNAHTRGQHHVNNFPNK